MWDLGADRLVLGRKLPGMDRVVAVPGACATLADGTVQLHLPGNAKPRLLREKATAVSRDGNEILVAAKRQVYAYDIGGNQRARYPADMGVTAVRRILLDQTQNDAKPARRYLALGFRDGKISITSIYPVKHRLRLSLEDTPASPVVAIQPGPKGTLIAGYANGVVGLWSLRTGARLHHGRLHGPVVHLVLDKGRLYAASELGQHLVWDLGIFHVAYCKLMRRLWARIHVVWQDGRPRRKPAPADHRCVAGGRAAGGRTGRKGR
jgi:hypothetical protein